MGLEKQNIKNKEGMDSTVITYVTSNRNVPIPSSIYWKVSRLMSAEAKAVLNMSIVPEAEDVATILTEELDTSLVESLVSPEKKQHCYRNL
jgi:hypothetical protein